MTAKKKRMKGKNDCIIHIEYFSSFFFEVRSFVCRGTKGDQIEDRNNIFVSMNDNV